VRAATQAEGAGGKPNFKILKIQILRTNYVVVKQYSITIGTFRIKGVLVRYKRSFGQVGYLLKGVLVRYIV